MSTPAIDRALERLSGAGATLARTRDGAHYAIFPGNDQRRRPILRLKAGAVRELEASGAIVAQGEGFVLSAGGRARTRRTRASPGEAFSAQHRPVTDRAVIDRAGDMHLARGFETHASLRRLAQLRDNTGSPWLTTAELAAAAQLRSDWELGEIGVVRGSDWSAPPIASNARGAGNAREHAMAHRCDARRRVADALEALARPMRRVVERVCLHEDGLEALERAENWPARSGKLALKLGLAQLAAWRSGQ